MVQGSGNGSLDRGDAAAAVQAQRLPLGKRLLRSPVFQAMGATLIESILRFTWKTNRDAGSTDHTDLLDGHWPVIFALWHGQHLLIPYAAPREHRFVSLVSRSLDAEINARVIERVGHAVIRGSGGRDAGSGTSARKGSVSAVIAMRNALRKGTNVVMIADISKGAPRQAGEGIVALARLSGRPVVPMALATSRHRVIEKSWDRTTINLPFGKRALRLAPPVFVSPDADETELAEARARITAELNRITSEAYQAVGKSA